MTVTARPDVEQPRGRVVCVNEDGQGYALVDDDGTRIDRFDGILRNVHAARLGTERVAHLLLDWQRHAWRRCCPEDYVALIWDDAVERVLDEVLGIFEGALRSHLEDPYDRVGVEEEVNGVLNALLTQPPSRLPRSDTYDRSRIQCECGCGRVEWTTW